MNNSLKLILVIVVTFAITILTSLLLELELFKTVERRILIDALLFIEVFLGYIIFTSIYKKPNKV